MRGYPGIPSESLTNIFLNMVLHVTKPNFPNLDLNFPFAIFFVQEKVLPLPWWAGACWKYSAEKCQPNLWLKFDQICELYMVDPMAFLEGTHVETDLTYLAND